MTSQKLLARFLEWVERSPPQEVVSFADDHLCMRYAPFWPDESHHLKANGRRWNRPPWWRPFNLLFHHWEFAAGVSEEMHDHPRWSVTICLSGQLIEMTPWGERLLKPGSIVVRSRKAIHAFRMPEAAGGEAWTLFIVGRRNHRQNVYVVKPQALPTPSVWPPVPEGS